MKIKAVTYKIKSDFEEIIEIGHKDFESKFQKIVTESKCYYQFQKMNRSNMQFKSELERINSSK